MDESNIFEFVLREIIRIHEEEYDRFVGLDPGLGLIFGGISFSMHSGIILIRMYKDDSNSRVVYAPCIDHLTHFSTLDLLKRLNTN